MSIPFQALRAVLLTPALAASSFAAHDDSPPDPWPAISAAAEDFIAAGIMPGAVIGVLADGKTEIRGYGALSRTDATKPDADTVYEIGSISKVFTSLLLADAVERGEVKLDDLLQAHAPEDVTVPDEEDPPIALVHLATHTSALVRDPPNLLPRNPRDPFADYDRERVWEAVERSTLGRAPGAKYEYSNFAMGLLGEVLVARTGEHDYESLLKQRVLDPLSLADTWVVPDEQRSKRLAPPHGADLDCQESWHFGSMAGCGAIRSTASDMLRFAAAQLDPTSTPFAKSIPETQKVHFEDPDTKTRIGLGWHFTRDGVLVHDGQTGGYHTLLGVSVAKQTAVVVLANAASAEVGSLGKFVLRRALRESATQPSPFRPIELEDVKLAPLVGRYRLAPVVVIDVVVESEGRVRPKGLYAQLTGQQSFRLYPESETRFRYRVVEAAISFELKDGAPLALVLHQNGLDQRAEKMPTP